MERFLGLFFEICYDKAGYLTSQTAVAPVGSGTDQTTLYYHNARGQTTETLYADGGAEIFTYDPLTLESKA